jgi:hypothetical protein
MTEKSRTAIWLAVCAVLIAIGVVTGVRSHRAKVEAVDALEQLQREHVMMCAGLVASLQFASKEARHEKIVFTSWTAGTVWTDIRVLCERHATRGDPGAFDALHDRIAVLWQTYRESNDAATQRATLAEIAKLLDVTKSVR